MEALAYVNSSLVVMRAPSPVTLNKAGANYRSEVPFLEYHPQAAYLEWLAMCDAVLACGGDALVHFEEQDERFLDVEHLRVMADGTIVSDDSSEPLGTVNDVLTGRVFSANGPWVIVEGRRMRALLPNMLTHRTAELPYYEHLLAEIADACDLELKLSRNPYRWEGMADVVVCGERAILTYTVRGHYDKGVPQKTLRSSLEGANYAKEFAHLGPEACVFAELVYPHFHGDTVQFTLRTSDGPFLMAYPEGLFPGCDETVIRAIGEERLLRIDKIDAVEHYAANSRQIEKGVLVPDRVSAAFTDQLIACGRRPHPVGLTELFGKAGGGPGCATLYLPHNLELPPTFAARYSTQQKQAHARTSRVARTLRVESGFYVGRSRG
ncbi:MAG: hypothetical protein H6715_03165 [Myxococcales bacterium]|nr:hypothetical protein [Myxococcales bacterium]MCB9708846.1 hypothetical protein [Myxococcales bacterium]